MSDNINQDNNNIIKFSSSGTKKKKSSVAPKTTQISEDIANSSPKAVSEKATNNSPKAVSEKATNNSPKAVEKTTNNKSKTVPEDATIKKPKTTLYVANSTKKNTIKNKTDINEMSPHIAINIDAITKKQAEREKVLETSSNVDTAKTKDIQPQNNVKPKKVDKKQEVIQIEEPVVQDLQTQLIDKLKSNENIAKPIVINDKKKKKNKNQATSLVKIKRYSPDKSKGLSNEQVAERNFDGLVNKSNIKHSKTYKSIFFGNIFTFFNLLCIIVAIALISVGAFLDTYFMLIIITNIAIGIIQEIKAKRSIEKLSLISSPIASVIREGLNLDIPITDVVLDDIITLSLGKQIPTDCIMTEGMIEVNESLLTGESIPVKKEIGDLLLAGSFISAGNCIARAEKVGKDNYIQNLTAKAKKYRKPHSELLNSIKFIIKVIGAIIIPMSIFMLYNNYQASNGNIFTTITKTATVIIGMIPSGMLLLTSMALAVGVIRLFHNNTLVQDLYSLEMLARVNVLCLDKTGTITDGRMKVSDCMLLNNNSDFTINEIVGSMLSALNDNNQTSIALYNHFGHSNTLKPLITLPFSSKRKLSAVSFAEAGTYILGAPEFVLSNLGVKIERLINQYATMGLRVLLIAKAPGNIVGDKLPQNIKPVAIITLADNIREDAATTIKWFKDNDVNIKVISGDNPITVSEVARRVGIENAQNYISLEGLNDKEVANVANKYSVFGRVTPEQKCVLIKAIKANGNTVAMTGDGVNDILAMKESDCSIAMASGSEAARNVSHLVLTDSNFSSMPKVVLEGRRVINNIQRSSSLFLMKTLFTTIFALIAICTGKEYPFTTTQMILLEVCVIGIPSFFLALQTNNNRVQGKFIGYVISRSFPGAFVMVSSICFLMLMQNLLGIPQEDYETLAMLAISFSGIVILYRICSPMNVYRAVLFTIMVIVSILAVSFFPSFFGLVKLQLRDFLFLIIIVMFAFPLSKWLMSLTDAIRKGAKQQVDISKKN